MSLSEEAQNVPNDWLRDQMTFRQEDSSMYNTVSTVWKEVKALYNTILAHFERTSRVFPVFWADVETGEFIDVRNFLYQI